MAQDVDLNKVVRQHLEMESFFTGFSVKGKPRSESSIPSDVVASEPLTGNELFHADTPRSEVRMMPQRTMSVDVVKELEAIAAEVRDCRRCGLGGTRINAVPGEGNPRTRILFVGEAPGADEDVQGRPFVGRAGQLLDKIIEACGLKRQDVFIANILKCRPPDNRDPRPDEIVNCLPFLQRQIEILNPEVIVALGAHAARTLLNTNQGIGQLRGEFQEYCNGIGRPPIKLIATYHPAYLLRSYTPDNRRRVWEDMKKVLVELGLPVPERGKGA
ncbi:MAG TPA: uracil-DNA glycosylase [Sedimentisphaerales bacterium]|mgnify:FL=1|nr:uracil-DNA glycosylase [Sedimentisphaerales bacterium]